MSFWIALPSSKSWPSYSSNWEYTVWRPDGLLATQHPIPPKNHQSHHTHTHTAPRNWLAFRKSSFNSETANGACIGYCSTTFILTYFPAIIYINTPQSPRSGTAQDKLQPQGWSEACACLCLCVCLLLRDELMCSSMLLRLVVDQRHPGSSGLLGGAVKCRWFSRSSFRRSTNHFGHFKLAAAPRGSFVFQKLKVR